MNILLLVKRFDFGGTENHVCDLANALTGRGHEVWLLSEPGKQRGRLDPAVHFVPFRFRDLLAVVQHRQIAALVRENGIEVIHAHHRLPIRTGSLAGKRTGVPVIATVHGRTRYDLRGASTRERIAAAIFVSSMVLEQSRRYPELAGKMVYIPNGVVAVARAPGTAKRWIYYASRLDKRHGDVIRLLINSVMPALASRHPDVRLGIVGGGAEQQRLERAASNSNRRHQRELVRTFGFEPEFNRCLQDALLVLGVGRTALESLAGGIPVMLVNRAHLGPVVRVENYERLSHDNFVAVGAPPPTAASLLAALDAFLAGRAAFEREAAPLQHQIQRDFGIDTVTRKIVALYERAITAAAGTPAGEKHSRRESPD